MCFNAAISPIALFCLLLLPHLTLAFNVLFVTSCTRITATHFDYIKRVSKVFEANEHIKKVLILGLTESVEEEETIEEIGEGKKLTIWKRNRCGHQNPTCGKELQQKDSANPVQNTWRKRLEFPLKMDQPANSEYLDILMYNEKLIDELREWKFGKFDIGCWESTRLFGLQYAIFHLLGIKQTCITSAVPPIIPYWHMLGYERIVKFIPGLDLARNEDHWKVANLLQMEEEATKGNEIERRNKEFIEAHQMVGQKTYHLWQEELHKKWKNDERKLKLLQEMPSMEEMFFKHTRWLFMNYQPMLDYPLVEGEFVKHNSPQNTPKLRFVGGLGMLEAKNEEKIAEELDKETQEIFSKGLPVVLFSLGSVVDIGINKPVDVAKLKEELKEAEERLKNEDENKQKAKEEVAKIIKEEILLIEDALAKEQTLMKIFENFNGKHHDMPHAQFIVKYGPKPKNVEAEKYKPLGINVHAKAWLKQKAILAQGAHKMRVFISHCGLNSVMEAVKMGIPLICIPFFGDQLNNSEALASRGVAEVVDLEPYDKPEYQKNNLTNERQLADSVLIHKLTNVLKEFLSKPDNKYAKEMAKLKQRFDAVKPSQTIHDELEALYDELMGQHSRRHHQKPIGHDGSGRQNEP